MVVEPPTTIPWELPSFWKVTPDAIAMGVLVAGDPVASVGKRKVLVCPFATASIPLPDGKTENVVPDPTAADPPATMVVEPPITISEELPPFWNVTPGAMAIGTVLVEGAFEMGVGNGAVLVLPSAIIWMPLPDGRTEKVALDPTATPPPALMVVEPPTTISEELPSLMNVTPGIMAMGLVEVVAAAVVAGLMGTPLPPCDLVLTPGFWGCPAVFETSSSPWLGTTIDGEESLCAGGRAEPWVAVAEGSSSCPPGLSLWTGGFPDPWVVVLGGSSPWLSGPSLGVGAGAEPWDVVGLVGSSSGPSGAVAVGDGLLEVVGWFSGSSGVSVWGGGFVGSSDSSGGSGESVAVVWAAEVRVGVVPAPVSAGRGVVVGEDGVVVGDCAVVVPAPDRVNIGSTIW
jgi:hypothetical protein